MEIGFEIFDNHLLLAKKLVHCQRIFAALIFDDDQKIAVCGVVAVTQVQNAIESQQWDDLSSQSDHFSLRKDGLDIPAFLIDRFDNGQQRNDVAVIGHSNQQPVQNRQSQRQSDDHPATFSLLRSNRNAALQGFDVSTNDVHPDASARNIRHLLCRRKSGGENQLVNFFVGQVVVLRHDPAFDGFAKDAVSVEPLAVVLNFDDEVAALMVGLQADRPFRRLSGRDAFCRKFDPVIHRIANHVQQWIADLIDDGFVEFCIFALGFQMNLFAESMAEVSDDASHLLERCCYRHHPK